MREHGETTLYAEMHGAPFREIDTLLMQNKKLVQSPRPTCFNQSYRAFRIEGEGIHMSL